MKNIPSILKNCIYLLLSVLFLNGCYAAFGKNAPKTHRVEIKGMKFQPAELNVKKGDTVVWINRDVVVHDVTEETKRAWTSSAIPADKSWKMVAQQNADYFCSIHPVMKGKIRVQ
jgi:plastocyanin